MKRFIAVLLVMTGMALAQQPQRYIQVTWTPSDSTGVTLYNVYRSASPCSSAVVWIKMGSAVASPYDDKTAVRSVIYCYMVRAYNDFEESIDSNTAQEFIPPAPNPPKDVDAKKK